MQNYKGTKNLMKYEHLKHSWLTFLVLRIQQQNKTLQLKF